jgi:hypothetical protein
MVAEDGVTEIDWSVWAETLLARPTKNRLKMDRRTIHGDAIARDRRIVNL